MKQSSRDTKLRFKLLLMRLCQNCLLNQHLQDVFLKNRKYSEFDQLYKSPTLEFTLKTVQLYGTEVHEGVHKSEFSNFMTKVRLIL